MADQPTFQITVDDRLVEALFNRLPSAMATRIRQLVEGAAIDVQRQMRIVTPVGVTGQLRRAVRYSFNAATLTAEIVPDIDYAADVEQGTPPHYVSVSPGSSLRAWAMQKGLDPYAIQAKIAQRGTRKHPFVQPTYVLMKPKVENDIANGITALVSEANDGRV
jgi:hypothetical protein